MFIGIRTAEGDIRENHWRFLLSNPHSLTHLRDGYTTKISDPMTNAGVTKPNKAHSPIQTDLQQESNGMKKAEREHIKLQSLDVEKLLIGWLYAAWLVRMCYFLVLMKDMKDKS